jgi:hypothetical protein
MSGSVNSFSPGSILPPTPLFKYDWKPQKVHIYSTSKVGSVIIYRKEYFTRYNWDGQHGHSAADAAAF